jgi:regulator of replication initiation timing
MTEKTDELDPKLAEALATIEALKTSVTKLEGFNTVLKQENKDFKTAAQTAEQAREAAAEAAERANGDVSAIEKRLTEKFQKDIDRLTAERDALGSDLRTIRVDNEITRALAENNVFDHMIEPLTYQFKAKAKYENNAANIDGQTIGDYIGAYLGTDNGAHFRRGSNNSGASASGNTSTTVPTSHGFTKDNFNSKQGEWMVLAGSDPAMAKQVAIEVGRADLAATL